MPGKNENPRRAQAAPPPQPIAYKDQIGRGLLIALEGIDGSGTTTQLGRLAARLQAQGRRVHSTREPSQGPVGRLLREILLGGHRGPDGAPVDGLTMALLFAADRRDHLRREIEPALTAGIDVITDRYLLSSLAYQAEEAARDWVEGLAREVRPTDLTLLLDVPVAVAAARRQAAGRSTERYDEDGFQARVAANYRRLAAETPASRRPVVIIDGSRPIDEVTDAIAREVAALMSAPAC